MTPENSQLILLIMYDRPGESRFSIIFKKKKKVPEPRYCKNPLSDFFVIGRLGYVCLTTKQTSIVIGQLSKIYSDTDTTQNPIGRAEKFFRHRLFWLDAIFWSAQ